MTNKEIIDNLSKELFKGSVEAYDELERILAEIRTLNNIVINVKIATAKMSDNPEASALSQTGTIIENSLDKITKSLKGLELSTKNVRDISKTIGNINNHPCKGE